MRATTRRHWSRLFPAVALLLPLHAGAAQDPGGDCNTSTIIRKVLISVTSDDTAMARQPFPVRVTYPVQTDLSAAPDASGSFWLLTLADPVPLDSLTLQPQLGGFRATRLEPFRAEVRDGDCVGRAAFRFTRVWRVEVTSRPESLLVEEQVAADSAGEVERRRTAFQSRLVPWSDHVLFRVFVKNDESFVEEIDPTRVKEPILLNRNAIASKVCDQSPRCVNSFLFQLRVTILKYYDVEQLVIRMVPP